MDLVLWKKQLKTRRVGEGRTEDDNNVSNGYVYVQPAITQPRQNGREMTFRH